MIHSVHPCTSVASNLFTVRCTCSQMMLCIKQLLDDFLYISRIIEVKAEVIS